MLFGHEEGEWLYRTWFCTGALPSGNFKELTGFCLEKFKTKKDQNI